MTILSFAVKGLRDAASRPKMVFVLWLGNLLAAIPLYLLFTGAFGAALGASGLARGLAAKTDMNVLFEILTSSGPAVRDLLRAALGLILVYEFAWIFFAGGILQTLLGDAAAPFASTFFSGGGRFYGRFFRLTMYSLLLWLPAGVLFIVFDGILSAVQSDPNREQLGFFLALARYAFALALLHLIRMISDYARIRIAVRDSRDVFAELGRAVRFVLGRLGRTLALYYLLGLAGLAILILFELLDSALPKTSPAAIFAAFVLTQVFIAARSGLRIAYQSAQMGLYLEEMKTGGGKACGLAAPVSPGAAQDARGEMDQGPEKLQAGVQGDADQAERQEEKPDQRVEEKDQEGQRPTDDKQDQP